MSHYFRCIPAAVALSSLSVVQIATGATATSPSDGDQRRVGTAIEAFSRVLHDADIRPEDEDEPIVDATMVDIEGLWTDIEAGPVTECLDLSGLEDLPSGADFDAEAYSSARSIEFTSSDDAPIWVALAVVGDGDAPMFDVLVDAMLPESETCIEEAITSGVGEFMAGSDERVDDVSLDVMLDSDLGVGTASGLFSVMFSGVVGGQAHGTLLAMAVASTSDGFVSIGVQSIDGPWEPDVDLIEEALTAMAKALDS